jgi:hypothetical protein
MKKLLVVLSVLFLAALIAGSAFAVTMYEPEARAAKLAEEKAAVLKASGEFTFGQMTTFDAPEGSIGYANMYVDLRMWPDEYNTIMVELSGNKVFPTNPALLAHQVDGVTVPLWNLSTDIGKILDLPVGLVNTLGKTDITSRKFEVTGLAYERPVRPEINPIGWKATVSTDTFSLTAGFGFGEGNEALNDIGVLLAVPEIGPASLEAYYLVEDNADYKGNIGANVKALGLMNEMLDFAASFVYNTNTELWFYGVGATVHVDTKYKLGVSIDGNDADALNRLGIDANAQLTDVFGIDAAVGLGFFSGAETFQGAEFSVYAKVGMAKTSIGYQIKDNTTFNYVPAVANAMGGFFVAVDGDF